MTRARTERSVRGTSLRDERGLAPDPNGSKDDHEKNGSSSDGSRIVLTRDGGQTWKTLADLPKGMQALSFISPEKGWAAGPAGQAHSISVGQ